MASKALHIVFTDDDILMEAVKALREKKIKINEVYCPFPVHGLDKAIGLPHTRLAITSFLYGLVGLAIATWMMNFIMIEDWPQNIGGKPSFSFIENMPSFVPVLFEMTVFFAAHLMVITFYMRSRLWPFKEAENPDVRTTDDKFVMEILVNDDNVQDIAELVHDNGASEIKLIENK
jgi:hypothetical protein